AAEIVEVELQAPAADEIIVKNCFAGVNATDVNVSAGGYTPGKQPPIDLGIEAVGEVVAVGQEVTQFKVGDPVITWGVGGGYREYNPVKARYALPIPEATPEVLSLILSGMTAAVGLYVSG